MFYHAPDQNIQNYCRYFLCFLLSATCFAQVQLLEVAIIGNINNGKYWSNSSLIADKGDILKLSAVVIARVENMYSQLYLSEINQLVMDQETIAFGKVIPFENVSAKPPELYWYRIEPINIDTFYLNHPGNVTPFAVIPYHEVPIPGWTNQWIVDLRLLPDKEQLFPGTIWLKIEVVLDRQFVASPDYENRMKVYDTIDFSGLNQKVSGLELKCVPDAHSSIIYSYIEIYRLLLILYHGVVHGMIIKRLTGLVEI